MEIAKLFVLAGAPFQAIPGETSPPLQPKMPATCSSPIVLPFLISVLQAEKAAALATPAQNRLSAAAAAMVNLRIGFVPPIELIGCWPQFNARADYTS